MKFRDKKKEDKDLLDIEVNLYVEQNSIRVWLLVRVVPCLRKIGSQARTDIQNLMDSKVNLKIWVKVAKDWRKKDMRLRDFGYL